MSSSANRLVCLLQTGVSSDGTTLNSRALPAVSASVTTASPAPTPVKSGAESPGFSLGPTRSIGLPLNVTSPLRVSAMTVVPGERFGEVSIPVRNLRFPGYPEIAGGCKRQGRHCARSRRPRSSQPISRAILTISLATSGALPSRCRACSAWDRLPC